MDAESTEKTKAKTKRDRMYVITAYDEMNNEVNITFDGRELSDEERHCMEILLSSSVAHIPDQYSIIIRVRKRVFKMLNNAFALCVGFLLGLAWPR